jgi:outer membrane immunogenic protein
MSMEDFMRSKFWCGIGLLALITAGAGSAGAADLATKAPPRVAAPVYLSDWAGFYIGINGGYGWGDTKFDFFPIDNAKTSGGLVGGHAGYNWQYGSVVGGLEADFDGADINKTDAFGLERKTNELASVRARLGYVVFPGVLAYGTGGAGWGHTELRGDGLTLAAINQFGWVAGAGLEYKLVEHVLLRAEYLHYDFGKTSVPLDNFSETVNVVRGGISYKF